MPIQFNQIQSLTQFELLANQIVEGFLTGLHKSPYHGFSVEFAEHKLYNQGESTKNIDWKLFARTEKLFVKRFEEETNLRCKIILDVSSSMNFPSSQNNNIQSLNKLGFSCYAAAALSLLLNKQRDAVGIEAFNNEVVWETEIKSNINHVQNLIEQLGNYLHNEFPQKSITQLAHNLHNTAEKSHKRSMVIIFSDLFFSKEIESFEQVIDAIVHLKHNGHEVIIFNVLDEAKELFLDLEDKPYQFIDLENGNSIKLNPKEYKEQYIQLAHQQTNQIKETLMNIGIDFVSIDINQGFEKVLGLYLAKRSNLF